MSARTATTVEKQERAEQTVATEVVNFTAAAAKGTKADDANTLAANAETQMAQATANKQALELVTAIKKSAFIKEIASNASKNVTGKISEIMGPIWDEFKEMSTFGQILAVAATAALVVGVGYFSWKLVAGNWHKIREFVATQLKNGSDFVQPKTALKKEESAVATVTKAMLQKDEKANLSIEDAKEILKYIFKALGQGVTEGILTALKSNGGLKAK